MAMTITNMLLPINQAADEYTQRQLLNQDGVFCWRNFVPELLTQCENLKVISREEFDQLKSAHPGQVHDEYPTDHFFYLEDESGHIQSYCTPIFHDFLLLKFGVDSPTAFQEKWRDSFGELNQSWITDKGAMCFNTQNQTPTEFMHLLAYDCVLGNWLWFCQTEGGQENLFFSISNTEVYLFEHEITKTKENFTVDDIFWRDALYWPRDFDLAEAGEQINQLKLGASYKCQVGAPINKAAARRDTRAPGSPAAPTQG